MIRNRRRGITLVEVVVVVLIVGFFILLALFALPRQRETARLNGCRRNLMQIGTALALYDKADAAIPSVPRLDGEGWRTVDTPLQALLETLDLPDFRDLAEDASKKPRRSAPVPKLGRIPGFVCESDPYAAGGTIVSPLSYRATTGDQPTGENGAFAPGRVTSLDQIEDGDGRSFTAAFSERLVGNQRADDKAPVNYFVSGPILDAKCPTSEGASWFGDAGSSWAEIGWRSTLYNHALPPNASPSCIAQENLAALMGASSGHIAGINVLMFDGSVRTVSPTIDHNLWKAMATTQSAPATNVPNPTQEPR